MLEVKHLTVRSKEGRPLVQDVSFTLTPGKPMGLTGASGSGKTTIIKAVMGILPYGCAIESGEILLDGQSLEGLPARKRREYCGTVLGFIPQSPMTAFDPHMKIGAQMVQTFCLRLNLTVIVQESIASTMSCPRMVVFSPEEYFAIGRKSGEAVFFSSSVKS